MLKANGRVANNSYTETHRDNKINLFKDILNQFKEGGCFEFFKTTSSYIEIPPQNKSDDASTYILRKYKGIEFVTLGHTIYYVNNLDFQMLLFKNPDWLILGGTNKEVIRAEACFAYMNEEGRKFHTELLKNWNELTKPYMVFRGY